MLIARCPQDAKKGEKKSTRHHHPDYKAVFYGEKKNGAAESFARSTETVTNLRALVLVPPLPFTAANNMASTRRMVK